MCGRYTRTYTWAQVKGFLDLKFPSRLDLTPSYNVAPMQHSPAARSREGDPARELTMMRWGLIPSWSKDPAIANRLINARAETISTTPAFREAFRRRRCIIPITGFYEWRRLASGRSQPFHITRADHAIMLLAGIWERWSGGAEHQPIDTYAIITTSANSQLAHIHNRMPAILEPEQLSTWLSPDTPIETLRAMLTPAPEGLLELTAVGKGVNSVRNDDDTLVHPVMISDEPPDQGTLFDIAPE